MILFVFEGGKAEPMLFDSIGNCSCRRKSYAF